MQYDDNRDTSDKQNTKYDAISNDDDGCGIHFRFLFLGRKWVCLHPLLLTVNHMLPSFSYLDLYQTIGLYCYGDRGSGNFPMQGIFVWTFSFQIYCVLNSPDPIQCESKKIPHEDLWQFFQNRYEFFNQILHAYYAFIFTLDYEFLFNYLQL